MPEVLLSTKQLSAADLDRVQVRSEGRIVAEHVRVWARGATITDPVHRETAAWLRKQIKELS